MFMVYVQSDLQNYILLKNIKLGIKHKKYQSLLINIKQYFAETFLTITFLVLPRRLHLRISICGSNQRMTDCLTLETLGQDTDIYNQLRKGTQQPLESSSGQLESYPVKFTIKIKCHNNLEPLEPRRIVVGSYNSLVDHFQIFEENSY